MRLLRHVQAQLYSARGRDQPLCAARLEGAAAGGNQTASFASKTKKLDSKPIGHDVPGVGAYNPKSPRSRTVGGDSAFKRKVDRLAKERIHG